MKYKWSGLFGGGEIELPPDRTWGWSFNQEASCSLSIITNAEGGDPLLQMQVKTLDGYMTANYIMNIGALDAHIAKLNQMRKAMAGIIEGE